LALFYSYIRPELTLTPLLTAKMKLL